MICTGFPNLSFVVWRGRIVVECTGLENRKASNGLASSNLALSAKHFSGRLSKWLKGTVCKPSGMCYHKNMKFYDSQTVKKARKMRKMGLTFAEISSKLNAHEKTIARWCHNINSENKTLLVAKHKRKSIVFEAVSTVKLKIDSNQSRVLAAMLYWAEGGKYPQNTALSFCNSDPTMVIFFLKLLRTGFNLDESKFRVHLQIHDNQDKNKLFQYWSNLLDIPIEKFWKPTITSPTRKMKRMDYMGTCTVRYHDYRILLILTGIYKNISNGKVAEWPKAAHC